MQHVRVGQPSGITGIADTLYDPASAASVGLLFWGATHEVDNEWKIEEINPGFTEAIRNSLSSAKKFFTRQ